MTDLLLIARIADERIALPAAEVEAVVELDGITAVPRAAGHVAGLSALRSRVLTVIDCRISLELGRTESRALQEAIVVQCDGHAYALLVDGVDDVAAFNGKVEPVRTRLDGGWCRVAAGTVEAEGDLLLLLDPHALIAGPAAQAA